MSKGKQRKRWRSPSLVALLPGVRRPVPQLCPNRSRLPMKRPLSLLRTEVYFCVSTQSLHPILERMTARDEGVQSQLGLPRADCAVHLRSVNVVAWAWVVAEEAACGGRAVVIPPLLLQQARRSHLQQGRMPGQEALEAPVAKDIPPLRRCDSGEHHG